MAIQSNYQANEHWEFSLFWISPTYAVLVINDVSASNMYQSAAKMKVCICELVFIGFTSSVENKWASGLVPRTRY